MTEDGVAKCRAGITTLDEGSASHEPVRRCRISAIVHSPGREVVVARSKRPSREEVFCAGSNISGHLRSDRDCSKGILGVERLERQKGERADYYHLPCQLALLVVFRLTLEAACKRVR